MRTSEKGRKLIEEFEGLSLTAYQTNLGNGKYDVPTIGYGHTTAAGPPEVKMGMVITEDLADKILADDLKAVETQVFNAIHVPVNQNQFDCIVSFTFNLGIGNLQQSSLLKRLNQGDYDIGTEFNKWVLAQGQVLPGLVRRRQREKTLWESSVISEQPEQHQDNQETDQGQSQWFVSLVKLLGSIFLKVFGK